MAQRWCWPFSGGGESTSLLDDSRDRQKEPEKQKRQDRDKQNKERYERVADPAATTSSEKAAKVLDLGNKLTKPTGWAGSGMSYFGALTGSDVNRGYQTSRLLGTVGSVLSTGANLYHMATGREEKKDKALTAGNALSGMGDTISNGSLALEGLAGNAGKTFSSTGGVGIGGIIGGTSDLVGGVSGSLLANSRHANISKLAQQTRVDGEANSGEERFALEAQAGKARLHNGKALAGALTLGGGWRLGPARSAWGPAWPTPSASV